jgi:hypothetical protein
MPEWQLVGRGWLYDLALLRELGQPQNQSSRALVFTDVRLRHAGSRKNPITLHHAQLTVRQSIARTGHRNALC